MVYRKANKSDINNIAMLVTKLLGTCNISKNNTPDLAQIHNKNIEEIMKNIRNYYICEENNNIIGACGISDLKKKNMYGLELKRYKEILSVERVKK